MRRFTCGSARCVIGSFPRGDSTAVIVTYASAISIITVRGCRTAWVFEITGISCGFW
ncbi:uncharacterized protein [Blastocystis hominis]|uniref:Uncharacterized protein n=1 Tax=Blastocystis hominis TaxID=12968 RepID=D8MAC7_BLAHO|nr:uncharacterized protein [Blastocystis hominis]CBK25016.2 unnamed protein product [Blastocystis hominis]|eukprot:XP_012899064.1 uncharacterized protein [Blastocystis hominis]